MDAEVKQRRREMEQRQAEEQQRLMEQRQAEEQQRLLAQRQLQAFGGEFFTPNLFTSLPPPNLVSLPTPYISFPSYPSIKTPLEEILDLTVPNSSSSSQVSTQADMGVDNLSRQPDPKVDDFNLEEFIQEQPQQESQAIQESNSARDSDLLDMLLSLNSFITPLSQIASSSSDAPSSVPMVFSNSFSSSLSNFTPSLTPSSSSHVSLPSTDQQMLPLPNNQCSSEAIINVREVLNSMLLGGTEARQSVIQYQQPEWDLSSRTLL